MNELEEQRMGGLQQARFQDEQENKGEENKNQKAEQRINNVTAILMIITALAYDAAQVFLEWILVGFAVNWILNIWAWLTFYVWFKLKNVGFANLKRGLSLNGGFILEFIPLLEELPMWTASVIYMIITVKVEDKLASISPAAAQAFSTATGGK